MSHGLAHEWWFRIKFSRVGYYCILIVLPFYFETWIASSAFVCDASSLCLRRLYVGPRRLPRRSKSLVEKASVDLRFNMRMLVPRYSYYYYCPFTIISPFCAPSLWVCMCAVLCCAVYVVHSLSIDRPVRPLCISHWHQKRFPLLDYDLWFMKWKLVYVFFVPCDLISFSMRMRYNI